MQALADQCQLLRSIALRFVYCNGKQKETQEIDIDVGETAVENFPHN
jgi:hypothetical protein